MDFTVWNPAKLTENYSHPFDSKYIIEKYDGYNEIAWGIPYCLIVSNETTGFGALQTNVAVASTSYNVIQGER